MSISNYNSKIITNHLGDKLTMVDVLIKIKNTQTDEVKTIADDLIWHKKSNMPSMWLYTDGNFACDCNRGEKFGIEDSECGNELYLIQIINPKNNEVLYSEFDK